MPETVAILGAGFSYVVGLPLAKDLLNAPSFVFSRASGQRFAAVDQAWVKWQSEHPGAGPEQFLGDIYARRRTSLMPWEWAVELVGTVLASPRGDDIPSVHNPRYAGRITTPVRNKHHVAFWDLLHAGASLSAVVTFNYDLLAERGLRHRPMRRSVRHGFYYGGFARPQLLRGLAQPFSVQNPQRIVELSGTLPLYKLHGSLSWSEEDGELVMYQDMRPAFRRGGEALIVPPVEGKSAPGWLKPVWTEAEATLSRAHTWVVCGYSLPPYDLAARALFARCSAKGALERVLVLDPFHSRVLADWRMVSGGAELVGLDGLPNGTRQLSRFL
jgi:hypothetical protein